MNKRVESGPTNSSSTFPVLHADILDKIFQYFTFNELVSSVMNVCQLWRYVAAKHIRTMLFTYKGLPPMKANASGRYRSFHWRDNKWLKRWLSMVELFGYDRKLPLPPLLLNEEIMGTKVAFVMYLQQDGTDFMLHGGFHSAVPKSVLPFNVELELGFTFSKCDKSEHTVDKKMIVTMEHGYTSEYTTCCSCWPPLMKLYNICPDSWPLPVVTNITIRRVIPEYKWFFRGLAPLEWEDGKFHTIDLNQQQGTFDCSKEWRTTMNLSDKEATLSFPPLRMEDVAVCVVAMKRKVHFGHLEDIELEFRAKFHPSTPECVTFRKVIFKIKLFWTKEDNSDEILGEDIEVVTVKRDWIDVMSFDSIPITATLSRISLCILTCKPMKVRNDA